MKMLFQTFLFMNLISCGLIAGNHSDNNQIFQIDQKTHGLISIEKQSGLLKEVGASASKNGQYRYKTDIQYLVIKKEINLDRNENKKIGIRNQELYSDLNSALTDQVASKSVKIRVDDRRVIIFIQEKLLFDSGNLSLKKEGVESLIQFGRVLKDRQEKIGNIKIETDKVLPGDKRYPGFVKNWEMAESRINAIVKVLRDQTQLSPSFISGIVVHNNVQSKHVIKLEPYGIRVEIVLKEKK